jgi:hypothetical protein
MCHQLITPNFRNHHFKTEIHALIKLNHIMVGGSVPQCSYNDFGNQLQWMQYYVYNDFNVSNRHQNFDSNCHCTYF